MSYIYPIKFSFGTNIPIDIEIEKIRYLQDFFSSFFNYKYEIKENKELINKYKTIPVSISKIAKYSDILIKKLNNYLISEYQIIDDKEKFSNESDLVVIDIKANIRDSAIISFSSGIETILKNDVGNSKPRFVIMLDSIPSNYSNFSTIMKYVINGKVLFIDKKKRFQYRSKDFHINKDFSFDNLSKTALNKIKYKLIRKIGNYQRYEDDGKKVPIDCNKFAYDGSGCEDDISDFLFEKIVELQDEDRYKVSKIVYHCPQSPWLEDALDHLDTELRGLKNDYNFNYKNCVNINSLKNIDKTKEKILFVISLIHEGNTFIKEYKRLKEFFPNSKIKAITILFSSENIHFKAKGNYIDILISEDESVPVNYLLSVNQNRYKLNCPMCEELQMEARDISYINDDVLTSFETWTMCDEAGYIHENYEPGREETYPSLLPIIPNSLELIKKNAAFIAIKYIKHIERNNLSQTPDLTFVFPDETSNLKEIESKGKIKLDETPSGYFAETLMQLQEIEYFGIPREIITRLKDDKKFSIAGIQHDYREFYNKLKFISNDIIIIDEFGLSGGTLLKIIDIIRLVGKKPKAYFPIFNFNPNKLNENDLGLKVLSLYEFSIRLN